MLVTLDILASGSERTTNVALRKRCARACAACIVVPQDVGFGLSSSLLLSPSLPSSAAPPRGVSSLAHARNTVVVHRDNPYVAHCHL